MQAVNSLSGRAPPAFNRASRVLVIAPHPDDESLACGLALQVAAAAGATMSILYLTDGDNNAWPQRLIERKWRLTKSDRARWGELRRSEALRALQVLGLAPGCAAFAGLPDQGLTDLLMIDANALIRITEQAIVDLAPTHLFAPSLCDIHPDHNAAAVAVRLALRTSCAHMAAPELWTFAVHGDHAAFGFEATAMLGTDEQHRKKLAAIERHRSQLKLSGKRFRSYAGCPEFFRDAQSEMMTLPSDALRVITSSEKRVVVELKQRRSGRWRIVLVARDGLGNAFGIALSPSLGRYIDVARNRAGSPLALLIQEQTGGPVRFTISREDLSASDPIYLKIDHRPIFFDRAGWIEIAPAAVAHSDSAKNDRTSREAIAAA